VVGLLEMQATDSELFIALVAAVGTDLGMLTTEFETELTAYGYTTHQIRLSDFLAELQGHDFTGLPFDERLWAAMDAGNQLRRDWGRGDALALAAISDIVATRRETAPSREEDGEDTQPVNLDRAAFVIRSLKTPDELRTLRAVYGPRVFVVAAYSSEGDRLSHLADEIRASRKNEDRSTWEHLPEQLIGAIWMRKRTLARMSLTPSIGPTSSSAARTETLRGSISRERSKSSSAIPSVRRLERSTLSSLPPARPGARQSSAARSERQ
jgi:hypothetical protein